MFLDFMKKVKVILASSKIVRLFGTTMCSLIIFAIMKLPFLFLLLSVEYFD